MSEQYEIRILGTAYNVTTSENRDTVEKTARMVDETMRELMNRNPPWSRPEEALEQYPHFIIL